jgi:hypothetical protein
MFVVAAAVIAEAAPDTLVLRVVSPVNAVEVSMVTAALEVTLTVGMPVEVKPNGTAVIAFTVVMFKTSPAPPVAESPTLKVVAPPISTKLNVSAAAVPVSASTPVVPANVVTAGLASRS